MTPAKKIESWLRNYRAQNPETFVRLVITHAGQDRELHVLNVATLPPDLDAGTYTVTLFRFDKSGAPMPSPDFRADFEVEPDEPEPEPEPSGGTDPMTNAVTLLIEQNKLFMAQMQAMTQSILSHREKLAQEERDLGRREGDRAQQMAVENLKIIRAAVRNQALPAEREEDGGSDNVALMRDAIALLQSDILPLVRDYVASRGGGEKPPL